MTIRPFAVLYNKFFYRPIVRRRLNQVGRGFRLGYCSELINPHLFSIGDNFFSGPHCYFVTNQFSPVRIGKDVMFGPYCKLIGGNHNYAYTKGALAMCQLPLPEQKEIVIENGAWIGANAVILSGAHIGEGAVIGAMGLVNHSVPPYAIAVGMPAKRFFSRFSHDEDLEELLHNVNSSYSVDSIKAVHKDYAVQVRVL